ncbi:hypothetical protein [Methylomonas sp. AM2-LC]|uniref:hypothetical protein n=1 Tax=Methylomonas sp. AM2-LC TaxID=3153301 RepID=UPI0032646698
MFRYIKIAAISFMFISSTAFADADDWGYRPYVENYQYAPVVQEQFIVTPRGIVEEEFIATPRGIVEEVIYIPERVVEYQSVQPRYSVPVQNYYNSTQPAPMYGRFDRDDRW